MARDLEKREPPSNSDRVLTALVAGEKALEEKKADKALQHFQDVAVWDPAMWQAYFGMGRAYVALDRPGKARRIWLEGLNIDPGNETLRKAIGRLGLDPVEPPALPADRPWAQVPPPAYRTQMEREGLFLAGGLGLSVHLFHLPEFKQDRKASLDRLGQPGPNGESVGTGSYDDPTFSGSPMLRVLLMSRWKRKFTLGVEIRPRYERSEGFGWQEKVEVTIPDVAGQKRDDLFKETLFLTSPSFLFPGSVLIEGRTQAQSYFEIWSAGILAQFGVNLTASSALEVGVGLEPSWLVFHRRVTAEMSMPSLGWVGKYNSSSSLDAFGFALIQEASFLVNVKKIQLRFSIGGRWLRFARLEGNQSRLYRSNLAFFFSEDRAVVAAMAPNQNGSKEIHWVPPFDLDPRAGVTPLRLNLAGVHFGMDVGFGF